MGQPAQAVASTPERRGGLFGCSSWQTLRMHIPATRQAGAHALCATSHLLVELFRR